MTLLSYKLWLRRWAAVFAFAVLLLPMMGSGDPMARFDKLGHQMMCECGCGQILRECNHLGCPVSPVMLNELRRALDSGLTDKQVYANFISKYGPAVMAAPVFAGFNILAWVTPIAALLLGSLGAALLLHNWKRRLAAQSASQTAPALTDVIRERIRRETAE